MERQEGFVVQVMSKTLRLIRMLSRKTHVVGFCVSPGIAAFGDVRILSIVPVATLGIYILNCIWGGNKYVSHRIKKNKAGINLKTELNSCILKVRGFFLHQKSLNADSSGQASKL